MGAIFKRELKSYFSTPTGYIILAMFYFFLGIFFSSYYSMGSPNITSIIITMSLIVVIIVPIITMRLMNNDKYQKVDQILLTAPIKLTSIVLGKFFAAMTVYALGFLPTIVYEIIFASKVTVNVLYYAYALLGMFLLGATLISIGMFISSLTESTAIAAFLSLIINFFALFASIFTSLINVPSGSEGFFEKIWAKFLEIFVLLIEKFSFLNSVQAFGENIFSVEDVVYFLSIGALFIFLCVRSLEKRRWS